MRQARLRAPAEWGVSHYHVVSRVVNREFVLGQEEREQFVMFMRMYERLCGVRVLTFCILSNHFHLLVEVPRRREDPLGEEQLLAVVRRAHGATRAKALEVELRQTREMAGDEKAQELIASWQRRMWDLSQFMKTLKQRFTQWFNKRHQRKGTLWEERFRSSLIEGSAQALHMVAAYIDLNPVRAGIVEDPKDYRWSGYGEAVGGGRAARVAFQELMARGSGRGAEAALAAYRVLLFGIGGEEGVREDGTPIRRGFDRERVRAELARGGRLSVEDYLRCRVRYFTDGAVLGSREYVDRVFGSLRDRFGERREDGARRVRGLGSPLYAMRGLRVDAVSLTPR
jgi:putative transposase